MHASVAMGILLAWSAIGCRGPAAGVDPGMLRIQLPGEPATLDPSLTEDGIGLKVLSNLAEGLVGYTGGGELVPRAALDWSLSPDGRVYRFRLNPARHWSDGVPLEAGHFKTGIDRSRDPATGARLSELLSPIESVVVDGPHSLVIRLKRRVPYFLKVLTLPVAAPRRRELKPGPGPGSGRYWLKERKPDRAWELEANPHYGEPLADGAPRTIRIDFVQDESTALLLFTGGKFDLLSRVPHLERASLRTSGRLHEAPFWATYYVGFKVRSRELGSPSVRCGLARSIRKDEVLSVLQSGETRADSWVPPGLEGYFTRDQKTGGKFEAKMPEKLSAIFDSSSRNQQVMEKLQADFKLAGVELTLNNLDWKTYLREIKLGTTEQGAIQVFRMGWLAAFADPISHLQMLTSRNPNNHTGWSHPAYDRLVSEIEQMVPGREREGRILAAQKIVLEQECPVVPIYHYVQSHGVGPRISAFSVNGMGVVRWDELRLSQ